MGPNLPQSSSTHLVEAPLHGLHVMDLVTGILKRSHQLILLLVPSEASLALARTSGGHVVSQGVPGGRLVLLGLLEPLEHRAVVILALQGLAGSK